ncbi:UDP-N-acetylmuramoyl-L-alanyl-D-glutamate--2,6-diaminopimelate ligase [Candidatus Saccharibacteria bacterium]|nr:UDP-N-acetylmuramoyl-L-alanyl-D-glutamate--2,6-diaminopimelate ligase [Candidatus Saccharibacteria bacterium]
MKKEDIPFYNEAVLPYHWLKSAIYGVANGFPAKKLRVIGVTGTNGKTTTCFMVWKMLNEAGHKAGVMTTVGWGVDKIEKQIEHMTTVDCGDMNRRIKKIIDDGAEFLVLEISSHALSQFRDLGIPIEIAVMSNVTHEHLDYHKTFERYRDAKRKLFKKAKHGVINADDRSASFFSTDVEDKLTYGIKHGKVKATEIKLKADGVEYIVKQQGKDDLRIQTQIAGEFNVYNSLAAVCVGRILGLKDSEIADGIYALESVEGRMMSINEGQDFSVIIDFAHTPDAFEKLFDSLRGTVDGRIIVVHGGAGRRDEAARYERGEIMGREADIIIITEDDSRDEDPMRIAGMFVEGAEREGKTKDKDLFIEIDRPKAVELAFKKAKKGDLVLLLGKGHEKTLLRGTGEIPYLEEDIARKTLKKLGYSKKK